jgi:hypothetical protein
MAKEFYLNNEEHKVLTWHLKTWLTCHENEVLNGILEKLKYKFYFDPDTVKDHVGVPLADKWNFVHDNCGYNNMEDFHDLLWDFLLQVEDKELNR